MEEKTKSRTSLCVKNGGKTAGRTFASVFIMLSLVLGSLHPLMLMNADAAIVTQRYGDINEDGKIDMGDLTLIHRHISAQGDSAVRQQHPDWILIDNAFTAADVNQNGQIDTGDILIIRRHMSAETDASVRSEHPDWILSKKFTYDDGKTVTVAGAAVTCPSVKVFAGWALTPWPTVKLGSKTLKKGTDYSLSYKNNTYVGTATIIITGKGNYSGTVRKSFRIIPKGTAFSKLTPGSGKMTVNWKKQASQTTGYQIQYSSRNDFKTQKTVTVPGVNTVQTTVSGLAKNHRYYVRIRTFKTVGSEKYYSAWSAANTVTTGGGTSAPATVKLSVNRTIVPIGMKKKLSVSGTNSGVKWTSSAPGVATVSSSGLVVGKKSGTATIKAKVAGKTLSCTINVINKYDARQVANMVLKYVRNYYNKADLLEYRKSGSIVEALIVRPQGDGAPARYVRVNIGTGKAVWEEEWDDFFKLIPRTFVLWNCQ